MNNEIDKIIQDRLSAIPPTIKTFISSEDFEKKIKEIEQTFTIQNTVLFENEILLLCLGFVNLSNFQANIQESLQLDIDKARLITESVHSSVVKNFENELVNFLEKERRVEMLESQTRTEASVPQNLPTESHLEPMIPPKNTNPFLPPLNKSNVMPQTPISKVETQILKREPEIPPIPVKIPETPAMPQKIQTPPVTSELAAEISNLLNQKTPEKTTSSSPIAPTGPTTQIPNTPQDKLNTVVQKPRVEVEMVKKEPEKSGDPYRESIE